MRLTGAPGNDDLSCRGICRHIDNCPHSGQGRKESQDCHSNQSRKNFISSSVIDGRVGKGGVFCKMSFRLLFWHTIQLRDQTSDLETRLNTSPSRSNLYRFQCNRIKCRNLPVCMLQDTVVSICIINSYNLHVQLKYTLQDVYIGAVLSSRYHTQQRKPKQFLRLYSIKKNIVSVKKTSLISEPTMSPSLTQMVGLFYINSSFYSRMQPDKCAIGKYQLTIWLPNRKVSKLKFFFVFQTRLEHLTSK